MMRFPLYLISISINFTLAGWVIHWQDRSAFIPKTCRVYNWQDVSQKPLAGYWTLALLLTISTTLLMPVYF